VDAAGAVIAVVSAITIYTLYRKKNLTCEVSQAFQLDMSTIFRRGAAHEEDGWNRSRDSKDLYIQAIIFTG
jgi:hypothetical protein